MNIYRLRATGVIVNEEDLRLTSDSVYPETLTLEMIDHAGADLILRSPQPMPPDYDPHTQKVGLGEPTQDAAGRWMQAWVISPLYASEEEQASALDAAKRAKELEINQWRDASNSSTFPHAGKLIAVDALSFRDIASTASHIALFGVFPNDFPGAWKTTDNTYIAMPTVDDFKAMYSSMTLQGAVNFNRAQTLKQQVAAATTFEELAAITW